MFRIAIIYVGKEVNRRTGLLIGTDSRAFVELFDAGEEVFIDFLVLLVGLKDESCVVLTFGYFVDFVCDVSF